MSLVPLTAAGGAVLTAALCSLGPSVLRRLPEPVPEGNDSGASGRTSETLAATPERDTETGGEQASVASYRELAATPGLRWWLAAAGGIAGALLGETLDDAGSIAGWCYLAAVGVLLSYVDARVRLLPTRIIAPSYVVLASVLSVAALLESSGSSLLRAALGWAVLGGLYFVLWYVYPAGIGYGDVRLAGLLGLGLGYLGWAELVTGLYAGFLLGGVGGALLLALRWRPDRRYPFGPFLVLGSLVGACTGSLATGWYLGG